MDNPRDSLKKILSEIGPKPGKVAVNVAGFLMLLPIFALLYSLKDPNISKLLLLLIFILYVLALPILAILEDYAGFVTKFLRTRIGRFLFYNN